MNALFPPEHPISYKPESFAFLETIIDHTEGSLLDNYLQSLGSGVAGTPDEPASLKESPLHWLLQDMKYAQIRVLRALIKDDDVWTSLTSKYAKWSEGEIAPDNEEEDEEEDKSNREIPTAELSPNEDVYRPFFMALMHQDYDACRMMMLSDEEIGAITKREAEIVN